MKGTPGLTRRIRSARAWLDRPFLLRLASRLALAPAVAGAFLLLAAAPVLADGGPHVAGGNSGLSTLTADSCAGCHRAHTAQGEYLLNAATAEGLCLTCHGSAGAGATTDVESGIQYKAANPTGGAGQDETDPAVVAGALRGGGFLTARIDSANPTRISYPRGSGLTILTDFSSKVPVLATGLPATSAHLALAGSPVTSRGFAWGNYAEGAFSATPYAGPAVTVDCTGCHNPHGNGRYRILNPIPHATATGTDAVVPPSAEADVTDAALPGAGQVRNYTVKEGALLSVVSVTPPTGGDYWRKKEPWNWVPTWNPATGEIDPAVGPGHSGDRPNGLATFDGQILAWCVSCHTRYFAGGAGATTDSGDAIYRYRHATTGAVPCTRCHVAHGSNAAMTGETSASFPYPDGILSGSSRLLKVDNRGTCQQCHDPTGTEPYYPNTIRP